MKEKDKKNTFTKVCGVCYYFNDIKRIIRFCEKHSYKWYYITHRDFDENLEEIKLHYHFIIESNSNHRFTIKSLISDTLKINLFEKCSNVNNYLRYMIHIDYDNKKHYDIKFIKSNVSFDDINNFINNINKTKSDLTDENFKNVMLYIFDNLDNGVILSLRDIIKYCIDNNMTYKSSWSFTIINLLKNL